MNTNIIRIFALILLIAGITLPFVFENNAIDIVTGLLIGLGIGLLITCRITRGKRNSKNLSQ